MFLKAYPRGKAPVPVPERFQIFNSFEEIPESILQEIAKSYGAIFREKPWEEEWTEEEVKEKIRNEMLVYPCSCSYLATMAGNDEFPIGGFCWGAVISPKQIPQRMQAHTTSKNEYINQLQTKIKNSRILFIDEVAIVRQFRNTIEPLQFLFRPLLEIALSENLGIICWTSPKSKIYPFLHHFGFKEVATVDDIVFLYVTPEIAKALVKFDQNMSFRQIQKVISITSRLNRAKK